MIGHLIAALSSAFIASALAFGASAGSGESMPVQSTSAVARTDLIALLDPDIPIKLQTWSGVNCYGQYPALSKVAEPGLLGDTQRGQQSKRFGLAIDPLDPARSAYVFSVFADDPLTAGAKRCEALAPPAEATAIPRGEPFWYAFRLLVWEGIEAKQGRALLTQWHTQGFNPFFGLFIDDGHLSVAIRHTPTPDARQAKKPTTVEIWRDGKPAQRVWMTFVVRAKISPFASDHPYITIWRDGEQLVDRQGPIGYDAPGLAYAKIGYYHWVNDNPWDERVPQRSVYVSKAMLVRDPDGRYAERQMRFLISER